MYLYDKVRNNINVYETSFDQDALRKFKEERMENIRTAIIHTNDKQIEDYLNGTQIMFHAIDHFDEDKEKYSYIELTNNKEEIENYLKGKYDNVRPFYIFGNQGADKAFHTKLDNKDYTYLLTGGHYRYHNQYVTDDNILLDGELAELQPLLSEDIMNLNYLTEWDYNKEFFNIMNLKKINTLDYKQMEFMEHHELMHPDINLEEKIERSKLVLSLAKKK
jgi:hypothetical protein